MANATRKGLVVAAAVLAATPAAVALTAQTTAAAAGLQDSFDRSASSGWGTSTSGSAWRADRNPAAASVSAGSGQLRLSGPQTSAELVSTQPAAADVSAVLDLAQSSVQGDQFLSLLLRRSAAADVRVRVTLAADGAVRLSAVTRSGSTERLLASPVTVAGLRHAAGKALRLEAQVAGSGPVSLRARIYASGTTAPATWPLAATATSGVPTSAGSVGIAAYAGRTAPSPTALSIDNLSAGAGPSSLPTVTPTGSTTPTPTTSTPPATSTPGPTSTAPAPAATGGSQPSSDGYSVPAGARFVSPSGSDGSGDGSSARPWHSVGKAVNSVSSGTTVVMRGGSYHETVQVPAFKKIILMGYPGEKAWFDGASTMSGWSASGGRWATAWTPNFDSHDPTGAMIDYALNPLAGHPEQVWVDGAAQTQVGALASVTAGTFYVDNNANRLYLGTNPSGRSVTASTLTEAYYINQGAGSKILGVGFRRYATPIARLGAVKAFAANVVIENSVFNDNAMAGLSLHGSGAVVRSSTFQRNGQMGLQADQTDHIVVNGVLATDNNTQKFKINQASGGIKITHSRYITVTRSVLQRNYGNGLWTDQSCKFVTVTGNRMESNLRSGLQFELSAGLVFADNYSAGNGDSGVYVLEAGYAKIYNNLLVGNGRGVNVIDGARVAANNTTDPSLDDRYPLPDSMVTWEVTSVQIRGNIVVGSSGNRQLTGYDDARHRYGASTRGVTSDYNAYWRPSASSTRYFAAWGMYPTRMFAPTTFGTWVSGAGQDRSGVGREGGSDPYVGSNRMPTSFAPMGPALPSDVAAALGLAAGSRIRAGLHAATA
jgi:trimeric autotransporter adhesin